MDWSRTALWRMARDVKIRRIHGRVAALCEELIRTRRSSGVHFDFQKKRDFGGKKIIWQYWAQGYDNLPQQVGECLASVDKYAGDYTIVRLCDADVEQYIDIPDFVRDKRGLMTTAHFSDLLRLILLATYGGIWMDATILLSGPIPERYLQQDFFVFRRDDSEQSKLYWKNVYAYYFGWAKWFRVNMLSSFMSARAGGEIILDLCDLMLLWWQMHDAMPDYFFFQIMFDVYAGKTEAFPLESDTLPHYLQQSVKDPKFNIMSREEILTTIPIHKMTYKA